MQFYTGHLDEYATAVDLEVEKLSWKDELPEGLAAPHYTRDQFYNEVYENDEEFTDSLTEAIENSQTMVVVVGRRGQGKTTHIHLVLKRIVDSYSGQVAIYNGNLFGSGESSRHVPSQDEVDNLLATWYYNNVWNASRFRFNDREIEGADFHHYLAQVVASQQLSFGGPVNQNIPTFNNLRQIHAKIGQLQTQNQGVRAAIWNSMEREVQTYLDSLVTEFRLVHYAWASLHFKADRKAIFVFDNIDRFARMNQDKLFNLLVEISNQVERYNAEWQFVLVIRPENLYAREMSHAGSDERFIRLITTTETHRDLPYDSVQRMKPMSIEAFDRLLQKRERRLAATRSYLSWLSGAIVSQYQTDGADRLFNDSLRTALKLHPRFMRFVLRTNETLVRIILKEIAQSGHNTKQHRTVAIVNQDLSDRVRQALSSTFYAWVWDLYAHSETSGYDITSMLSDKERPLSCSIRHLALAWLLARVRDAREERQILDFATFEQMAEDFSRIGIDENTLWNALVKLHTQHNEEADGRLVYIQPPHDIEEVSPETPIIPNSRIWIMPRGSQFVRSTGHKYHFLLASLLDVGPNQPVSPSQEMTDPRTEVRSIEKMINTTNHLLDRHISALHQILSRLANQGLDLIWYRRTFGIDPRPVGTLPGNPRLAGRKYQLHLEAILANMIGHLEARLEALSEEAHKEKRNITKQKIEARRQQILIGLQKAKHIRNKYENELAQMASGPYLNPKEDT